MKSKRSRFRSCIGCLGIVVLLLSLIGLIVGMKLDRDFSIRSNFVFLEFRNSREPLAVKLASGKWAVVTKMNSEAMAGALEKNVKRRGDGFRWSTLSVRRKSNIWRESLLNGMVGSEVHVVEFDPEHFEFSPWFEQEGAEFVPSDSLSVLKATGPETRFVVGANYYGPDGQPLGWLVRDGKEIRKQWKSWSGFFFVKGGVPRFGPRSLLESTQGELTQATQGYPSVMKDGILFDYVTKNEDEFFNGSELNFRSLAGVTEDGRIIFVLSGTGGMMDMAEVTRIAKFAGVHDATLLDGGRALQYGLRGPGGKEGFHSFNNTVDWDGLPQRFAPERPPVFLLVRRKK